MLGQPGHSARAGPSFNPAHAVFGQQKAASDISAPIPEDSTYSGLSDLGSRFHASVEGSETRGIINPYHALVDEITRRFGLSYSVRKNTDWGLWGHELKLPRMIADIKQMAGRINAYIIHFMDENTAIGAVNNKLFYSLKESFKGWTREIF